MEHLLDQVRLCHPLALRTTISMALIWGLIAMPALAPAFLSPDDDDNNTSSSFISVQKEFALPPGRIQSAELTSSVYFLGNFFLGQLPCICADRIGRRPIVIATVFLNGLAGVLVAVAPSFYLLLIARFIQGANFSAMTMVNYVICCESISARSHATAAVIFGLLWVVGYCTVAPLAMISSTWRQLQFLVSAPSLVFAVFLMWTLPESPAFLASQGRTADLRAWITTANKLSSSKEIKGDIDAAVEASRSIACETSLWKCFRSIWRTKTTRTYLMAQILIWVVDFMMYSTLALTATEVSSDPYWSYILSGLVELPCYIVIPFCLDWFGRKPSVIGVHFVSGLVFGALILFPPGSFCWIILWLIAKFGMASVFMCCFVYGAEIFPVDTRNICLGLCATVANLGAFVSPHLDILDEMFPGGTFATFVFLCLAAVAATTVLPETKVTEEKEDTKL